MTQQMNNIKLVSTGHYVPERIMSNHDFEKIIDTSDEWITTRTGIKTRHFVDDELASDLAVKAAEKAIERINYDRSKIDLIIVATITPDYQSPSVANLVQGKLGLNNQEVMCFDVNAGCTGFVYALSSAAALLKTGEYQSALVIGSETLSKVLDYDDRSTCVLFGDGAGAMIIERTTEDKPSFFYAVSKGDLDKVLLVDRHIKMDGKKVYTFAINAMQDALSRAMEKTQTPLEAIDVIIPHQANVRIIQSVAKHLNYPMDRFYINIEKYGNTSAASVIIALDEYLEANPGEDQTIVLVAFGAGFTWGSALLTT